MVFLILQECDGRQRSKNRLTRSDIVLSFFSSCSLFIKSVVLRMDGWSTEMNTWAYGNCVQKKWDVYGWKSVHRTMVSSTTEECRINLVVRI